MKTVDRLSRDARVTVRRTGAPDAEGRCVVYWMQRAQRGGDNPALDVAIDAANALRKPVVAFLGVVPFYPNANLRHYAFLAQGIPDIATDLKRRGVGFVLRAWPEHNLLRFCEEVRPSLVVGDENPMREPERWRQVVAERLRVPLWTVDADVVVPGKLFGKEQFAARTLRPRLHAHLAEFLGPLPNPSAHVPWHKPSAVKSLVPGFDFLPAFELDRSVAPVKGFRGGTQEGLRRLRQFLRQGLAGYATRRNRPEVAGTSRLSPYLHFGHLGPHTVALAARQSDAPAQDKQAFLEELIVRRELAINFVRFNPHYDRWDCAEPWARTTLREHARDERAYTYSERQLENAETHDPLWNAAQRQMTESGWMHGYLRMYWAKKILEWTATAEEAFQIAVRLNDRYELDGRDPNGYAGIAWAIVGKHDRAWGPERAVYGKIRYMSFASTSRKFDSRAYIKAWGQADWAPA